MNLSLPSHDLTALNESAEFIQKQLSILASDEVLSKNAICDLLSHAHQLLAFAKSDEHQNLGLAVICHVAESVPNDPMCHALLEDCISASRNFHYLDMLDRKSVV